MSTICAVFVLAAIGVPKPNVQDDKQVNEAIELGKSIAAAGLEPARPLPGRGF
jgi:hypothetical protein